MQESTQTHRQSGALPSPEAIDLQQTALLLDVDGTLLDIAATPASVVVPEDLLTILTSLLELSGGALAFVSGRTIESVDRLFTPLTAPAVGGHGAEIRLSPQGPTMQWHPAVVSEALRRQLHLLASSDPGIVVEDKPHSIALHYRRANQQEAFLKKEVAAILSREASEEVEILLGKEVIEVKPKLFSKGSAVTELMTHQPFAGRTPLFIGDDTTDESVFAILPELAGFGYSVGKVVEGVQGTFRSPEHVRSWLARVALKSGRAA